MKESAFFKGTFILMAATLLSKMLGSIFRIPLQNIAGDEVLGIFSMVYPVYMMTLILSVAGIPVAISQLIAAESVKNAYVSIHHIMATARMLGFIFGTVCFALILLFSNQLAAALGTMASRPALITVSVTLIFAPFMAVYRGFFQGYEDMQPTAYSQVIEQVVRVAVMLGVAYCLTALDYGQKYIAGGTMVGSAVGAIASLLFLHRRYANIRASLPKKSPLRFASFMTWSRKILSVALPIVVGSITAALFNVIDAFTIPFSLRSAGMKAANITYQYGIYGRGLALVQIATVFSSSITLALIPLMTKKLALKDHQKATEIIDRTHWMTHLLSWPAAIGLTALALPLNIALFTNAAGTDVMAIICAGSAFISLTLLGTGILQGIHMAKHAAIIVIAGGLLKAAVNLILVHYFGLKGAALATLLVYSILFLANSLIICNRLSFSFFSKDALKMLLAACIMGMLIGSAVWVFPFDAWTRFSALCFVLFAAIIGATIYFLLLLALKVTTLHSMKIILFQKDP